ncbi:MAG: DNA-3-methyladenine glycosylase [Thaumarchaeota archaeon]|jgi:DNA-3-methyladenine glycosylase|nr:DNA-3-methyladenine glycosylase [Nitrososphaerota archaeon]
MEKVLPKEFYSRKTTIVAKELLGKTIVRKLGDIRLEGKIVETEAYGGKDDPASHAYRGITERNKVMFGEPGHTYVYFTYGNHWCLNFVAHEPSKPGAVLIRAIEPTTGIEYMKKFRSVSSLENLCNGPGKLTKALKIDNKLNGLDITKEGELYVVNTEEKTFEIGVSTRVGIRRGRNKFWRFFIKGNLFVSRVN